MPKNKKISLENFSVMLKGVGNDLKLSIDDIIDEIIALRKDVEKLKNEKKRKTNQMPDKTY